MCCYVISTIPPQYKPFTVSTEQSLHKYLPFITESYFIARNKVTDHISVNTGSIIALYISNIK